MARKQSVSTPVIQSELFPTSMPVSAAFDEIYAYLETLQEVCQRLQVAVDTLGDMGLKPDIPVCLVFGDRIDLWRSISVTLKL